MLKDKQDEKKFILPISWLFSLSIYLGIDVQTAFIKKYPSICPYCLESQCVCIRTKKMPQQHTPIHIMQEIMDSKYETIINTVKVYNLDKAVKNVTDIFTVNETIWRFAGAWYHIAKIHEEIAEIHEAYGDYRNQNGKNLLDRIAEEIADVLAWILGAWGITNPNKSLDEIFIDYYYKDCPLCNSFPCKCGLYDSRLDSLIDIRPFKALRESLYKLNLSLKNHEDLLELINSYDLVLKTPSGPSVRVALTQTKDILNVIEDNISPEDSRNTDIMSAIQHIRTTASFLLKLETVDQVIPDNTISTKQKKFDVFLSYSTIDKDEARKIEAFLSRKKIKVFLSEKTIKPSEEWKVEIRDALENSKLLCMLATPNSLKSEWVTREQGAAWGLRIRILPILYQCASKDLPDVLRDYQTINFHEMAKILDVLKEIS